MPDDTKILIPPKYQQLINRLKSGELTIENQEQYMQVAAWLPEVREVLQTFEKQKYAPTVRPAWRKARALSKEYKTATGPIQELEDELKRLVQEYVNQELEAKKQQNDKRITAAMDNGQDALASAIAKTAQHQKPVPEVKGVQVAQIEKFRIVDEYALPRDFLMPDEDKIKALVKIDGDKAEEALNGAIEVFIEPQIKICNTAPRKRRWYKKPKYQSRRKK